jgi:FixJ family two-component response regulator
MWEAAVIARSVLLLDDDDDLRAVLAELFIERGARCMSVASVEQLIALGHAALSSGVAILDVNLGPQQASGVDAYEWLMARGYAGRVAFLTGHARSHPVVARAYQLGAQVLEKPVSTDTLDRLLDGA